MTFLPIVVRELRVAARSAVTFRNRVLVSGAVGAIAVGVLYFGTLSSAASRVGGALFEAMSWIALVFCALAGVVKTADSLSEEKREGTLGLLFLTNLRGYDVVLGKFVALSLGSMHGLLSLLPILAVSFLLGGVAQGEFWRMVLALANIQFFSLCAGMAVSSSGHARRRVIAGTLLLLALAIGLPFAMGVRTLFPLSPFEAFYTAFDARYRVAAGDYWWSFGLTQGMSWLLLVWASLMAPTGWHEQPARGVSPKWQAWVSRWQFGSALRRAKLRTQMLQRNPVLWLAGRNLGAQRAVWVIAGVGGVTAALFTINSRLAFLPGFFAFIKPVRFILGLGMFSQAWFGLVWLVNFALKVRIALQACHCLAEARRNQAVEMLLTTPLTVKEIIAGQLLALQNTFLAPLFLIFGLEIFGGLCGSTHVAHGTLDYTEPFLIRGMGVVYFAMFALDSMAAVWAGMWFGLTCRKENEAAIKTVLFVLIFPLVCLFFWPIGGVFMIAIPLVLIGYARSRLLKHFRLIAAQRNALPLRGEQWLRPPKDPKLTPAQA